MSFIRNRVIGNLVIDKRNLEKWIILKEMYTDHAVPDHAHFPFVVSTCFSMLFIFSIKKDEAKIDEIDVKINVKWTKTKIFASKDSTAGFAF